MATGRELQPTVPTHLLAVLDGAGDRAVVVPLPAEPDSFADLLLAASTVSSVAPQTITPAGPALVADGVVLHRLRARLDGSAVAPNPPPAAGPLVEQALDEETGRRETPAGRPPWCRAGWAEETEAWLDDVLPAGSTRTGPAVVVRTWPLSHVQRVPTDRGDLFLKTAAGIFAHEAVVTAHLAQRFPDVVPQVVAVDAHRGCLLMRAFAGPVPEHGPQDVEPDARATELAAAATARLHLGSLDDLTGLRAAGATDRTLPRTREAVEALVGGAHELDLLDAPELERVRRAWPWALDRIDALAALGLPATLVHGDLHPGNYVVDDDRVTIFDWTDACVSHPFVDLVHLRGSILSEHRPLDAGQPWVAAYLAPWREGYPDDVLLPALALAPVVERLFQAVTYDHLQRSLEGDGRRPLAGIGARILLSVAEMEAVARN